MAAQLFRVCNEQADDEMAQQFYHYYDTWKHLENDKHLGIYYNMQIQKFVFINRSNNNQLEIADFLDPENELTGFGPLYTRALRDKILHIRANVHYV